MYRGILYFYICLEKTDINNQNIKPLKFFYRAYHAAICTFISLFQTATAVCPIFLILWKNKWFEGKCFQLLCVRFFLFCERTSDLRVNTSSYIWGAIPLC
jgi:hypothetical protein